MRFHHLLGSSRRQPSIPGCWRVPVRLTYPFSRRLVFYRWFVAQPRWQGLAVDPTKRLGFRSDSLGSAVPGVRRSRCRLRYRHSHQRHGLRSLPAVQFVQVVGVPVYVRFSYMSGRSILVPRTLVRIFLWTTPDTPSHSLVRLHRNRFNWCGL